jgi:proton glutamate symport protein
VSRVRDPAQIARYLLKLMGSYVVTSAIAVGLGVTLASLLQPGQGLNLPIPVSSVSTVQAPSIVEWLIHLIPTNPFEALSSGNLIQIILSAALISVGIQQVGEKAQPVVALIESLYLIFEKVLSILLYIAPVGVLALVTSAIATQGLSLISRLAIYVLGLLIGFALMIGLYGLTLWSCRINPLAFCQNFSPSITFTLGTASTNAALPLALQNAQDNQRVHHDVASFSIPLGTVLKRDGSAIYQTFNALFIAQLYHIPITNQLIIAIAVSAWLVSMSTAGVPGAGMITMTTVLAAAGLPLEGVAIVAGVDRLTDGIKTTVNLLGNLTHSVLLDRWETQIIPTTESS